MNFTNKEIIKNIEKANFTNEEISDIDSFLTFNEKFFTKILKVSKKDYRKLDNIFGGKMTDILEQEKQRDNYEH